MSDNEHTAASLGHSEVLSVQHSVGEPIPEFDQPPEDGTKVPSSVARQNAGDVLPHHPAGPCAVSKPKKLEGQVAAVVSQSSSEARDAEGDAGRSSDQKVNCSIFVAPNCGEVPVKRDVRPVVLEDSAWEGVDLAERGGFPP
jgi:hypothetical protein